MKTEKEPTCLLWNAWMETCMTSLQNVTKIPLWIIPRRKNQPHSRRDERGRCGHSFRCTFLGSGRQDILSTFAHLGQRGH